MENALIVGGSRGLGGELAKVALEQNWAVTTLSRKVPPFTSPRLTVHRLDLSQSVGQDEAVRVLHATDFRKIFYVAGGGPYGVFQDQSWTSHEWAWQTTFLACAKLLHAALKKPATQFIALGSAVAEGAPDPKAASYAASKHALKGLLLSAQAENPACDLRLFSPGYMDTALLPAHAAVRQLGVWSPVAMAQDLWDWSLTNPGSGHKVYAKHP